MRSIPFPSIQLLSTPTRAGAMALAIAVSSPFAAEAIGPQRLVEDVARGVAARSSSPTTFVRLGQRIVFIASDPLHGRELRGTALDAATVELLADALPGTGGSDAALLATLDGAAFFANGTADDPTLWVTDGTAGGTRAVTDESGSAISVDRWPYRPTSAGTGDLLVIVGISRGRRVDAVWAVHADGRARLLDQGEPARSKRFYGFATVGKRVFYVATGADLPHTLWVTDGTEAGTRAIAEVPASIHQTGTSTHYFFGVDSASGDQLWASDGTAAGTRLLVSFGTKNGHAPLDFNAGPSRVYFIENDSRDSQHLWVSDGTPAGTRRISVPDLRPASGAGVMGDWLGDTFVFVADDGGQHEIWTHDGTAAPPLPLPPRLSSGGYPRTSFVPLRGLLLFPARSAPGEPFELWRTDGTPGGTVPISRTCSGCLFDEGTRGLASEDQALFVTGYASSFPFGRAWIIQSTDGSDTGTRVLRDSVSGDPQLVPWRPGDAARVTGGYLLMASDRSSGDEPQVLNEADGSVREVANLEPETGPSAPDRLRASASSLYWIAKSGTNGPFASAWTLSPGSAVERLNPNGVCSGSTLSEAADLGARQLFSEAAGEGACLASFEPASGQWTEILSRERWEGTLFDRLVVQGGFAYFRALEGTTGALWRSDGTVAGTARLTTDALPERFELLAATPSHLFLRSPGDAGVLAVELGGGTVQAVAPPIATLSRFFPRDIDREHAVARGRFFFTTLEPHAPEGLAVSDGTAAGTRTLWVSPEGGKDRVLDLFAWRDQVLFLVASERLTLWHSDGTAQGTVAVADLGSLAVDGDDTARRWAVPFAGRLFFTAETDETGAEIWATDGTAAGTRSLDLVPGPTGSEPRFLAVAGGRLFFAAEADESGREVWTTDGTVAGTRRVSDIAAGSDSAAPEELVAVGTSLYFSADDGFRGRELWAIDASADGHCVPGLRRLCLQDGRFSVEASWRDSSSHSGPATALPLSDNSGAFWFFDAANLEAVVKLLDGRTVNDHYWLFAGSLSNLGYDLQVTDTETRTTRRYTNPPGQFASLSDVEAFAAPGPARTAPARLATVVRAAPPAARTSPAPCLPSSTRLCLREGRFAVEARWRDFLGNEGVARAVALTPDAGTFWFFDEGNVELAVKLLDGREVNSRFWLFYGALSDVEYTLTATDTLTGAVREYVNPAGRLASVGDTDAF